MECRETCGNELVHYPYHKTKWSTKKWIQTSSWGQTSIISQYVSLLYTDYGQVRLVIKEMKTAMFVVYDLPTFSSITLDLKCKCVFLAAVLLCMYLVWMRFSDVLLWPYCFCECREIGKVMSVCMVAGMSVCISLCEWELQVYISLIRSTVASTISFSMPFAL